jgi:uncharacterized protein (TIGR03435 family)
MTRVWFLTILAGALLSAHSPPPAQSAAFEVASVKENNSGDERFGWGPRGGTFQTRNLSLRWIIAQAYGIGLGTDTTRLDQFVLLGGPAAILDARFDIVDTLPGGAATPEQIRSMLRALLAERFNLRVHTEARQMPSTSCARARPERSARTSGSRRTIARHSSRRAARDRMRTIRGIRTIVCFAGRSFSPPQSHR